MKLFEVVGVIELDGFGRGWLRRREGESDRLGQEAGWLVGARRIWLSRLELVEIAWGV